MARSQSAPDCDARLNNKQNKKIMDYFVAQEDTNIYNVFSVDDFNNDGFLVGHEDEDGYHRSDFDIVEWFDSFEEACDWIEEHSN